MARNRALTEPLDLLARWASAWRGSIEVAQREYDAVHEVEA